MKVLSTLIILLASTVLFSQTKEIIHLWPDDVPGETTAKNPAEETDNKSRGVIRLTNVTDPLLTVFRPEKANGAGIVVCPGGGYNILAINLEGYEIAEWLASLGYTAFVLQYRVPDKKEGALMDAQRAIRVVRSMKDSFKLDGEKIGIMGFSAGGSLSARTATLYEFKSYAGVDQVDELSSKPNFACLIYPAYLDLGENRSLTPELKVDGDTPPMFIFETADDPYGNSALVMSQALRDAKVPVELHFMPEGGHGYGLRPGNPAAETWPGLMKKWLGKVTSDEQRTAISELTIATSI